MNCNLKNFNEWDYINFSNEFLDKVKGLSQDQPSEIIEKTEFLKTFKIKNKWPSLAPNEEISQTLLDLNQSFEKDAQIIIKKKWNDEEKKALIWTVYYYLKIYMKKLEEMVFYIFRQSSL